jgi:hypothetical protein
MMMLRAAAGAPTDGMRVHFIDRNVWTTETTLPRPPRRPPGVIGSKMRATATHPIHGRVRLVQRVSGPVQRPQRHWNGGRDDGSIECATVPDSPPQQESP